MSRCAEGELLGDDVGSGSN